MKIILINPPWILSNKKNAWNYVRSCMPPLGLASIAAVLEEQKHQVSIVDAHAEHLTLINISEIISRNGPFDIAGITATTPLINNAYSIAELIKSTAPTTKVILGGVHPTVLPDEVLSNKCVDIVVRGEGEVTMSEIAAEKSIELIDGISFRHGSQIIHNKERALIPDLNSLPMPAYHLLPMKAYRPAVGAAKREPAISMVATRGCPGRCTFCYKIFGKRLRFRSGAKVATEVAILQEKYGIKEISFYDDTFTVNQKEIRAFCEKVIELKLDLTWSCFSRIDNFKKETFQLMKKSGCHQVMFGVESFNQTILDNINKNYNREKIEYVIKTSQMIGLETRAAFMLGNPGETEETIVETIKGAINLEPDLALFNITTPYPGTEMFFWADKNNYLLTYDWRDYDLSKPVMKLPTISPEKIRQYYSIAHRKFYLRPKPIIKRLKQVFSCRGLREAYYGLRMVLGL